MSISEKQQGKRNILKFIFPLSLLFLLNGCFIPFYSAKVMPKDATEVGTGIIFGQGTTYETNNAEWGSYPGDIFYDQSIFFIRKGLGHNMDYGVDIGPLALSLDIRRQVLPESNLLPSLALSGNIFGFYLLLGSGYGSGISLQFHKDIVSFVSNYFYMRYAGEGFGGNYTIKSNIYTNTLLFEAPATKKLSLYFLIGIHFAEEKLSWGRRRKIDEFAGISFVWK